MTAWWYNLKGNKKEGPIDLVELNTLIINGKIDDKALLWHEGMDNWKVLEEIEELRGSKVAAPPPLPVKSEQDPLSYSLATNWQRFFARIFDTWWEIIIVAVGLGWGLGTYSSSFAEWINKPGADQLFTMLCLPIAMVLDACVYQVAGNTPGKAFLGLTVGTIHAKPLGFSQYLTRNFSVWFSGLALGFPLINLYTMSKQSGRLKKGLQTNYDEPTGFRVRAKPCGLIRKTLFGIAFVSLFAAMIGLGVMSKDAETQARVADTLPNYNWENPVSQLTASINPKWKYEAQPNDQGGQVYMFTENTNHAAIIFAKEDASAGYSMSEYLTTFKKANETNMHFSDGGRYFESEGHQAWEGTGNMVGNNDQVINVQVIQFENSFWRVVSIQTMPHDFTNKIVNDLRILLWATVK